jgi:hypothetical protein
LPGYALLVLDNLSRLRVSRSEELSDRASSIALSGGYGRFLDFGSFEVGLNISNFHILILGALHKVIVVVKRLSSWKLLASLEVGRESSR